MTPEDLQQILDALKKDAFEERVNLFKNSYILLAVGTFIIGLITGFHLGRL